MRTPPLFLPSPRTAIRGFAQASWIVLFSVTLGIIPASAQAPLRQAQGGAPNCFPFEAAVESLWAHYGERPILQLLTSSGVMILVYGDEAGASWTMVALRQPPDLIRGQGRLEACQQSSGEFWRAIEWERWEGPGT